MPRVKKSQEEKQGMIRCYPRNKARHGKAELLYYRQSKRQVGRGKGRRTGVPRRAAQMHPYKNSFPKSFIKFHPKI